MFENLGGMMKAAREMQGKMQEMQQSLGSVRVTGEAGAGMATVEMNGKHEVVAVHISPDAMADREMLEGLVHAATNDAARRVAEEVKQKMSEVAGGLNLPNIPGMF